MKGNKEVALFLEDDYYEAPLDDSVYNPANSEYHRSVRSLTARIVAVTSKMRAKHALITRELATNLYNYTEIAKKYHCAPQTVSKIKKTANAKELLWCIARLNELRSGTKALHREMLLWEIALREKDQDPRTSIAAVGEINRMKIDTDAQKQKIKQDTDLTQRPTVIIQLADSRLAPSQLDHYEHDIKDVN